MSIDLKAMGELLRTQDDRITSDPIFVVEQLDKEYGIDPDYSHDGSSWCCDDVECASEEEAKAHDREMCGDDPVDFDPSEWRVVYWREKWRFVTACFTEQACKNYIAANGHNLCQPRIYVHSGNRNYEWIDLREFFTGNHMDHLALLGIAQKMVALLARDDADWNRYEGDSLVRIARQLPGWKDV